MIIYPTNWRRFGMPIAVKDIDDAIRQVISEIDCINLSFSGGLDSSLLLYYLMEVKGKAHTFTVANATDHPDIEYSQKSVAYFEKTYRMHIAHTVFITPNLEGDDLVRAFYKALRPFTDSIIAGDCIDELSCGYYAHQDLREETYHDYLCRLQAEHLYPLNENSGDVAVYLPYADDRVANLLYRVPLYEKVNIHQRKAILTKLAEGRVLPDAIWRKKYGFATSANKALV